MKFLRHLGIPCLMALWLLAALPGNLADLVGSALNLPVSAATSPADEADNGVPCDQLLRRVQVARVEIIAAGPSVAVALPPAPVANFLPSVIRAPRWLFVERAAGLPRAPSVLA